MLDVLRGDLMSGGGGEGEATGALYSEVQCIRDNVQMRTPAVWTDRDD